LPLLLHTLRRGGAGSARTRAIRPTQNRNELGAIGVDMASITHVANAAAVATSGAKLGGKENHIVAHSLSSSFALSRPLSGMVGALQARKVSTSGGRGRGGGGGSVLQTTRAMAKELYFNKDGSATKKMQVCFVV